MDSRAISDKQCDMMWHAIGNGKGYRNRYAAPANTDDSRAWDALVAAGLAEGGYVESELAFYRLTPDGVEVVAEKMGFGKKRRATLLTAVMAP